MYARIVLTFALVFQSNFMPISCPPTEEVAAVTNVRVGLFQPNTLEIVSRGRFADSRAVDFRWEVCDTSESSNNKGSSSTPHADASEQDNLLETKRFNYRVREKNTFFM